MDYEAIKTEARKNYAPFYEVAKAIVDPMVVRVRDAAREGLIEVEDPIEWSEAYDMSWEWSRFMEHENDIRRILEDCRRLLA